MRNILPFYIFVLLLTCVLFGITLGAEQFTVSGIIKDGLSNRILPDAKVYLTIQSYTPSDKQKIEYSARTTTDVEGKYQFAISIDTTALKRSQYMQILVAAKGYIGTIDADRAYTEKGVQEIKHNFALLPEGKEAMVKGTVRDAVTRTPLLNIPVELSLVESDFQAGNYIQKNKETRKLVTDANGVYETQIPSIYVDRIKATSRWWVNIQSPDYEVAATDPGATGRCCSRDTTKPEPEQETNIAMNIADYYLVSKTATGKLEGTLLDANNKPSSQTKLRIEIGTGGATMNMTDMGGG